MKQLKIGHAAKRSCVFLGSLLVAANAWAATWYVNGSSGADGNSGLAAVSAKATIQAAVDAASAGDTIRVAPGTYDAIDTQGKDITIRSTDGAEKTKIVARTVGGVNSDGEVTAALLISDEVFGQIGDSEDEDYEPGPFKYDVVDEWRTWTPEDIPGSMLEGFTIEVKGVSENDQVGVVGGRIKNCRLTCAEGVKRFNLVQVAVLENCLITAGDLGVWIDDDGSEDGDVELLSDCILNNCTFYTGSMLCSSQMENTIVYGRNGKVYLDEGANRPTLANSVFVGVSGIAGRTGVTVADPLFVDAANGDFRLRKGSPCIDKGGTAYGTTDLARNPRVVNGTVDVGCYEYQENAGTVDADNVVPAEGWPSWVLGTWTGPFVNVVPEDDGTFVYNGSYELTLTSTGSHEKFVFDDGETGESDNDKRGWKIVESRDCHVIATCWCWNDEKDDKFDATYVFRNASCKCGDGKSSFKMLMRMGDDTMEGDTVEGTLTKVDVTDPENPTVRAAAADVSAAYDGEGHGISVAVTMPTSGATVEYARAKDGPWQADAILFTNACATTKVWYRVLADGYAGVTNAATVTVTPRAISATMVALSLPESGYKYDGAAKEPMVSVTDTLAGFSSSDYAIAYVDNVNAGTAKVVVTGVGNYAGTVEATFAIAPRELTFTSADAEWAWDGAAHACETTPIVTGDGFVGSDGVTFSDFASVTAPGAYENTFAYAFTAGTVASNYVVTQVCGTLLVHNYQATVKDDGTVRIDGLGGEALGSTELVIPETIGGVPVTEVKEGAFKNSTCGMETLKLAKYCRKIGARAFHGVRTLQRVAFVKVYETDGVTEAKLEIGAYAFGSTGVSSLVVPDDVQEIGDYAFSNCGNL